MLQGRIQDTDPIRFSAGLFSEPHANEFSNVN